MGLHEFFDMMVPLHLLLRRDDLFFDIEANVGTYTVLAAGICGGMSLAFEPDPNTLHHMRRNIEINRLADRVQVYECALGATRGEVTFTEGLDTENRIATTEDKKTRTARMGRLDGIASGVSPIMMKVDVEGAELEVLSGADHLLGNPLLRVIELETVAPQSAAILARHGFEQACYDPFHRALSKHPDGCKRSNGCKSSNSLFVRDWAFVADRLMTGQPVEILGRSI